MRARHEIDTVRSKALFDRLTGLYTEYGLQHWVEQLGARALRKREPIACLVVAPDVAVADGASISAEQSNDALAEITDVCRAQARRSDILGYLGDSRVAILAPDTDVAGVQRLIDRLQQAIGQTREGARGPADAKRCEPDIVRCRTWQPRTSRRRRLVRRAETALAYAPRGGFDSPAVNFDEVRCPS